MPDENESRTRAYHDMGGLAAGPVDQAEHDHAPWEKRVDAIVSLVAMSGGVMTVDELRRGIESLGPKAYDELAYYERWIASVAGILLEKGVLDRDVLDARVAALRAADEENL